MVRTLWGRMVGAALVGGASEALAQEPAPPSGPVTVTTLPHPSLSDTAVPSGGPPACAPFEDCNGPLLKGDPLLDGQCGREPGWFTALETDIVKPHIRGILAGTVNVAGMFNDTVALPNAPLDWTASPRIDVGYRFSQAAGEVILSYRSLVSEGNETVTGFDIFGDAHLKSRLNVNTVDLDYGKNECSLGPCWDMKWRVGVRLTSDFSDSRAVGPVLEERSSNHFLGAGPHLSLELSRNLGGSGLALYGRFEGTAMLGQISQSFEEVFTFPVDGQFGGATKQSTTQGVPVIELQAGVAWTPWSEHTLRVLFGYELESWWYAGSSDNGSRSDMTVQGVFLRGVWGY